jgi:hypothetical protein
MKDKIKCLIEFTAFISIVIFLLFFISDLFTPKWTVKVGEGSIQAIKGFYNLEPNTIDVMFIGDSSIRKGISPMQIYEDSGITSYSYCNSSSRIYMFYYFLQDVLKTQKPKVVVSDPLTLFYMKKEIEPDKRKSFDYMPLSVNKINMINDDIFELDFFEKASYVFPILRYHSRYNELHRKDFTMLDNNFHSVQKGFIMSKAVKPHKNGFDYMKPKHKDKKLKYKDYSEEYLEKYVKLCKENNIELIILGIPDIRVWGYEQSEKMKEYASKYGFKYLDINNESTNINWLKDTEDAGGHFNIKGAQKITKYVTNYLKDNYDLPDHRNDPKYQSWNDDLVIYNDTIKELIK